MRTVRLSLTAVALLAAAAPTAASLLHVGGMRHASTSVSTRLRLTTAAASLDAPPSPPATTEFFRPAAATAGADAAAEAEDSTKAILLFLPGIDGAGLAGGSQWGRLSTDFAVHALRVSPADRSSQQELLESIEAFLAAEQAGSGAGADGRFTLVVGESWGGLLALQLALRSPDLVSALCLVNPATAYETSLVARVAPLLPSLPRGVYQRAPALIAPLLGKPAWLRPLIGAAAPPPGRVAPSPAELLQASAALADLLPPEAFSWRLEQLAAGAAEVNARLAASAVEAPWAARTLLLAGQLDFLFDSAGESARLQELLPGAQRRLLGGAGHACLDDGQALNLRLELQLAGILPPSAAAAAVTSGESAKATPANTAALILERSSPFEQWLGGMRSLFSPLFYSRDADGALRPGLGGLPPIGPGAPPLLLVGNHQLYGFDGPLLIEEFIRERGVLLTALVYPPLLERTSLSEGPLAPFPYPLPGTADTFARFEAVPASARAMFRSLSAGKPTLLFPGGGREVFKRKGEEYQIFWPDEPDVVRLAARLNATIVPFSGIGGDESFSIGLDSEELLASPGVGAFFAERIQKLPSLVKDDVFVPPFGMITPQRHYFLFGRPVPTDQLSSDDDETCRGVYDEIRAEVLEGVERLRALRAQDPYAELARRTAVELSSGVQAPGPLEAELDAM